MQPHPPQCFKEAKSFLKQSMKMNWRKQNDGYNPEHQSIKKLSRKEQTKIFRLRMEHCALRAHLQCNGLRDSAACPCGTPKQTLEDIVQDCPNLARQ
jgi:cytidine deaminase